MPPSDTRSLREVLRNASDTSGRFLWGIKGSACLHDLARGSCLGGHLSELSGRSVLLATHDQLVIALALIELDGTVRRLTLCPPELTSEQLSSVIADADVDAIVSDLPQLQSNVSCVRVAYHSNIISTKEEQLDRYSGSRTIFLTDPPTNDQHLTITTSFFARALAATIQKLRAAEKIIFVHSTPEIGQPVPGMSCKD